MVKLLSYFIVQFADYTYFITRGVFYLKLKLNVSPSIAGGFIVVNPQ